MKIKFFFAWFDIWIGAYWSKERRTLYICPLPMYVVELIFYSEDPYEDDPNKYIPSPPYL